jgi:hypothetical protein
MHGENPPDHREASKSRDMPSELDVERKGTEGKQGAPGAVAKLECD